MSSKKFKRTKQQVKCQQTTTKTIIGTKTVVTEKRSEGVKEDYSAGGVGGEIPWPIPLF